MMPSNKRKSSQRSSNGKVCVEEILTARRTQSQERLKEFVSKLNRAEEIVGEKACVYATGSFGRSEASRHSDLDLFIVGRGTEEQRELKNLDEICLKAELIELRRNVRGF